MTQGTPAVTAGDRNTDCCPPLNLDDEEHRSMVLGQVREPSGNFARVLLEVVDRNATPAMTPTASQARGDDDADPALAVLLADRVIPDARGLLRAVPSPHPIVCPDLSPPEAQAPRLVAHGHATANSAFAGIPKEDLLQAPR